MGIVEFEQTPNPDALCVRPGRRLTNGPPLEFARAEESTHPLVAELLAIDGIDRIMIAPDFLTVVRSGPRVAWEPLRPLIALALVDTAGVGLIQSAPPAGAFAGEVERHIEEVLNRYVRHLLAADGGEAVLVRFDAADGTAWVRMGGACGGCPSGITTLKRTIEHTIRRWVPEVKRVRTVEESQTSLEDPKVRFRRWIQARWGAQSA